MLMKITNFVWEKRTSWISLILIIFYIEVCINIEHNDRVFYLPKIGTPKTTTYSGYINVNQTYGANLFYLFWESQNITDKTPIILWLNGGPGCSSLFGSFIENGPYLIDSNGTIKENPYSWNQKSHLLYVDQPVGTGYSYVKNRKGYVKSENMMASELLTLLNGFFKLHPKYYHLDLYIFGESYAGKYIPNIAQYILQYSSINLKAIGIGDGYIDPYIQSGTFCPFLETKGLVSKVDVYEQMIMYKNYLHMSDNGNNIQAEVLGYKMLLFCSIKAGSVDVYDINYPLFEDPTKGPSDALVDYLNNPDVMTAFNADHEYKSCDAIPYIYLSEDFNLSVKSLLQDFLNKGLPILLYSGNDDLICNHIGTELLSSTINWSGQDNFNNATTYSWYFNNDLVGSYKNSSGLTYYLIYNAGHMVPFYQPELSLNMIQTYLINTSL